MPQLKLKSHVSKYICQLCTHQVPVEFRDWCVTSERLCSSPSSQPLLHRLLLREILREKLLRPLGHVTLPLPGHRSLFGLSGIDQVHEDKQQEK